uniref:Uncharacterized protein n=1 Tax=Strigamia maritima TaxID=126957 RepID=T1JFK7_STRMM
MKVIFLTFVLLLVVSVIVSADDSFEATVDGLQESDESVTDDGDYEERHEIEKRGLRKKWKKWRKKAKKALKKAAEAAAKAKIANVIAGSIYTFIFQDITYTLQYILFACYLNRGFLLKKHTMVVANEFLHV